MIISFIAFYKLGLLSTGHFNLMQRTLAELNVQTRGELQH